jgi:hypothetical protein
MENKYTVLPRYTATFWTREIFGGTTSEHSYAWTHELAMNLLNGKDDGYKGMLNLCTYVNVLFDNLKLTDKSFSYSINHSPIAINSLITQSACVYLDRYRTLNEC